MLLHVDNRHLDAAMIERAKRAAQQAEGERYWWCYECHMCETRFVSMETAGVRCPGCANIFNPGFHASSST